MNVVVTVINDDIVLQSNLPSMVRPIVVFKVNHMAIPSKIRLKSDCMGYWSINDVHFMVEVVMIVVFGLRHGAEQIPVCMH